jgi:hypothetical protein
MVLASVAMAKAGVDEWTFFSGAHLGLNVYDCALHYLHGEHPVADAGSTSWGGAPKGQQYLDFRSNIINCRVLVCYRESDGQIVLVDYWKLGGTFLPEEMRYLTNLNRPYPPLVTRLNNPEEFIVSSPEQDKLEDEAVRPL